MDVRIEQLGVDDVGPMRAANLLFGEAFDDHEHYGADPPSDDHLRRLLGDHHFVIIVASCGGELIGALTAYELVKYERATSELFLYDVAVASHRRREGVAKAMIGLLRRIAADRGASTVFVEADGEDAQAAALYENFGMGREVRQFDILPLLEGRR